MPQEFYSDGSPSRTEIEYVDGPLTRFADDATIAELERQARRIAELETALAAIHATSRRVTHHHEWYLDGVRQSPGAYVVMRVGDAPDAPVTPF